MMIALTTENSKHSGLAGGGAVERLLHTPWQLRHCNYSTEKQWTD